MFYILGSVYTTRENQEILYAYPGIASHYVGVLELSLILYPYIQYIKHSGIF